MKFIIIPDETMRSADLYDMLTRAYDWTITPYDKDMSVNLIKQTDAIALPENQTIKEYATYINIICDMLPECNFVLYFIRDIMGKPDVDYDDIKTFLRGQEYPSNILENITIQYEKPESVSDEELIGIAISLDMSKRTIQKLTAIATQLGKSGLIRYEDGKLCIVNGETEEERYIPVETFMYILLRQQSSELISIFEKWLQCPDVIIDENGRLANPNPCTDEFAGIINIQETVQNAITQYLLSDDCKPLHDIDVDTFTIQMLETLKSDTSFISDLQKTIEQRSLVEIKRLVDDSIDITS